VEVYARVRRAMQIDRMSIRQAAHEFELARKTIRKMRASSATNSGKWFRTPAGISKCCVRTVTADGWRSAVGAERR
jgi:hypothetical protein